MAQAIERAGLHAADIAGPGGIPAVRLNLIHDVLPDALQKRGVARRQIGAGDLQIQDRLPERFVFGVQDRQGVGFVPGPQAGLLAGDGVFAVVNPCAPKQDETCFHGLILDCESVRSPRVNALWASFSEFCRMLAEGGLTRRFTDSGLSCSRKPLPHKRFKLAPEAGLGPGLWIQYLPRNSLSLRGIQMR